MKAELINSRRMIHCNFPALYLDKLSVYIQIVLLLYYKYNVTYVSLLSGTYVNVTTAKSTLPILCLPKVSTSGM